MDKLKEYITVKITIDYDGTNYSGWQKQKNGKGVQEEIEKVLSKFYGEKIDIEGSGRTDKGVHAKGQVASFRAPVKNNFDIAKLPLAVSEKLPPDISILTAVEVDEKFNARKDAKQKTYQYSCYLSRMKRPTEERFRTNVKDTNINIPKMEAAANFLVGEHDFSSFVSTGSLAGSRVRTISEIKIKHTKDHLDIFVTGNGFLYNMVRIIVGTLLEIGTDDERKSEEMKTILLSKCRLLAGKTAPANGLCLLKVIY